MRTKITFLAAAALAAGLASSMAQSNVYSVNIVGYINVPMTTAKVMLENPLDNGTNDINSIDNGAIPNKSVVSVWNGTGFTTANKASGTWTPDVTIAPGTAFFITPKSASTITFIGQAPASNNYALTTGKVMIGALLPIDGFLNDPAGPNALNLGASLPNKSVVSVWNGTGFTTANKASGTWTPNLETPVATGLFVTPKAATTWTQYLQ